MTGTVLVLLALSAVLPPTPSLAAARLSALRPRPKNPSRRLPGLLAWRYGLTLLAAVGAGATFALIALLAAGPPILPAGAGVATGGMAGHAVSARARRRRRDRAQARLVESVGGLAADVRAGQRPEAALAAMAPADRAAVRGSAPIASIWSVSERSGVPVAKLLDRVEQDLLARARQRREVSGQLAGARSTAALLAVLPLVGIGLGAAMGAGPLTVLFGTSRGQLALIAGVGLDALGALWTARIVAHAGGER